jgi:hypothetical protein
MVLLVQPASVRAQYQVGGNGHALDANNQVGSGGLNGPARNQQSGSSQQLQPGSINNNVVYGNVSGLNGFQGRVRSFDPTVFQGNTGSGPMDRLDAISAPVNYAQRTTGQTTYTPYYNATTFAPTPTVAASTTLVQTPGGQGYVPAPVINPLIPSEDVRVVPVNQDPNAVNTLPAPGELNVAGPLDPAGNASLYSMSPLYGVRQMDSLSSPGSDTFYQSRQNIASLPVSQRLRLTPAQIQSMRDELNKTVVPDQNGTTGQQNVAPTNGSPANSTGTTPAAGAMNLDQSGQVSGQPISTQVQASAISNSVTQAPAATGDLSTGMGQQNQLLIPTAAQQSKQLKALEDKYAKIKHLSDVQAADKFNQENQLRQQLASQDANSKKGGKSTVAPGAAAPGSGGLGAAGLGGAPVTNHDQPTTKPALQPILTPQDNTSADNQPTVITSLATGIQAKGLADLMKSAEDKMRQGKFTEAVDTYETAQAVAPNNPFIALGRSFAELGASFYGKADQDLTRAIIADPAVLAGKYDLNGFLGEDRVKFVNSDLADLAAHQKSARPLVLLAFIAHNNGDDATAATDLDQAAPRGQYDSLIALMRSTWGLKVNGK